jgi:hypothetical protein
LKFLEVWAGRACAGTNEKEFTTWAQGGGWGFEKIGRSYTKKKACTVAGDHRSPAARGTGPLHRQFFQIFLFFLFFFGTFEELLGILEE